MSLIYRTYDISMASIGLEFSRQIGTPILLFEIAVILFGLSNGCDLGLAWRKLDRPIKILATAFLATFSISSIFVSENPVFSIMLNLGTTIQVIFCVTLSHCLGTVDRSQIQAMKLPFIASMLIVAFLIVDVFLIQTPPHAMIIWQFAIPGFISVRLFGAVCGALGSFLLVSTLLDEEAHVARFFDYVGLTFLAGLTIWSGTRAAILGIVVAVTIAAVFFKLRPRIQVLGKVGACLVVAAIVATALLPPDTSFELIHTGDYASTEAASGGRLAIWAATWDVFLAHPMFGAGAGATKWAMPIEVFPHVQPHNVVLQFLMNWGTIGGLAALALLASALWHAHKIAYSARYLLPVLAMLDSLIAMSLVDGIFHFARETMMVMMCFAIIFRAGRADEAPELLPSARAAEPALLRGDR